MKGLKIGAIIFFFLLGMILILESPRPSSRQTKLIKEDVIETISLKTYQQVRVYVKGVHEVLDEALNDDGKLNYMYTESVKWQDSERAFINIEHDLIRAMGAINDSSPLYDDLKSAKDKLKYGRLNRELEGLIDAHNIVHDLEHFFFYHDRTQQYFGVTKTLSRRIRW
ncbi:hypothetical protein HYG86_02705 [Alkalicella caledoniensis]|uniref:Uncharacterized protein n=1 Tax=Alkalicella caledoniensis TaxID=2731377 RepID=A0A7G9W4Y3_ALKCA|nr:hypothetical protein [Alkalicella caledoniensis]QNO13745.1 hypothetical protein HYG86_02705 [Alkalicella caledoniensis]